MNATIYASIKARMAGVALINSGLISLTQSCPQSHHSYRQINSSEILAGLDLPPSTKREVQFDGKLLFHKKIESIYRFSPSSVRRIIDAICLDLVCDLLKTKIRSLHTIHSQSQGLYGNDISRLDDNVSLFLNFEHRSGISSATTFSELESVVESIFDSNEFKFDPERDCRSHEEQIDHLYLEKLFEVLSKSSPLCRRHLNYLYRLKFNLSRNNIDQRSEFHHLEIGDKVDPPILSTGFLSKKQSARDEGRYLTLLKNTLRRSPITPLPIFAYILILEVWCNRVAGLLSLAQIEPGMNEL